MERREFLHGSLLGGGIVSLALFRDSPDYRDSLTSLRSLTETIDNTDIANPQQSPATIVAIEETLERSQNGLQSSVTNRARRIAEINHWIDTVLSTLPGVSVPPAKPPIETKIAAIKAAHSYYDSLLQYVQAGNQIRLELEARDFVIMENAGTALDEGQVDELLEELSSSYVRFDEMSRSEHGTARLVSELIPQREQVLEDATRLKEVYSSYVDAQKRYTVASKLVSDAASQREQRAFQTAQQLFDDALTNVKATIPSHVGQYSLSSHALSLQQYQQIMEAYREAIPLLKQSCTEGEPVSQNQLFGAGLDRLFDARHSLEAAIS